MRAALRGFAQLSCGCEVLKRQVSGDNSVVKDRKWLTQCPNGHGQRSVQAISVKRRKK